jgi:hypothetical protein
MSSTLGVIIMLNNYFHDVATALLLASGVTMWIILKNFGREQNSYVSNYFLKVYKGITNLARFSLIWIILGGIPRTIFYKDFEWSNAAGNAQIPALIVKHILAFLFVTGGAYLWIKLSKRVKEVNIERNSNPGKDLLN